MKGSQISIAAAIAITCFLGLIGYSFTQLLSIERALRNNTGENMLWLTTQADRAAQALRIDLLARPTPTVLDDDVSLRLDVLFSRVHLLTVEPQASYFQKIGSAETPDRLSGLLGQIDVITSGSDQIAAADKSRLLSNLGGISEVLGSVANMALLAERDTDGAKHDAQRSATQVLIVAVLGLLLSGGVMAWQLLRSIAKSERSEEALRRHRDTLEETVAQRTRDIQSALLAETHAKEIYRSFITTVSHQFRTPLSIILMVSQRLGKHAHEVDPPTIIEKSARLTVATQRLVDLVASVTNIATIDSGRMNLLRNMLELNDIVLAAVIETRENNPHRVILFKPCSEPTPCHADRPLIAQVVLNLVSNAVKYSQAKTEIHVSTKRDDARVTCVVADCGMGIPLDEQTAIFTRFYRARNVERIAGSGLGLNLSKAIAELHGGSIEFASTPGEGSTFSLHLPLPRVTNENKDAYA